LVYFSLGFVISTKKCINCITHRSLSSWYGLSL